MSEPYRAPPRAKFIQIAIREYDVFALDEEGCVWRVVRTGYDQAGNTVEKWKAVNMERVT